VNAGSDDEQEGGTNERHFGKGAVIDVAMTGDTISEVDGTVKEGDGAVKEIDGIVPLMSGTCHSC
jgi:hypothetical protein